MHAILNKTSKIIIYKTCRLNYLYWKYQYMDL